MLSRQQADYGPGALIALAPLDRDRIISEIMGDEEALLLSSAQLPGVGAVAALAILPKPLPGATSTPVPAIPTPIPQPTTFVPSTHEAPQLPPDTTLVETPVPSPVASSPVPPTLPPTTIPPPTALPSPTAPPSTVPLPTIPPPTVLPSPTAPPPTVPPPTAPPPTSPPPPLPSIAFSNANVTINEADGSVSITVILSAPSAQSVNVNYATGDGTATAGNDYGATNGGLTFAPGQTSQTFVIPINYDAIVEPNETFNISLSNPVNANLGTPNPTVVNIIDNTPTVQFSTGVYSVNENGGAATITVTLSAVSPFTISVDYASSDGSAIAGSDYTAVGNTLTFAPGQTNLTFTVPVTNDNVANEISETVNLNLSNPVNAAFGATNPATLTIIDDDLVTVAFSQPQFSVNEGDDGGTGIVAANIQITLSNQSAVPIMVDYATVAGGSAMAGADYLSITGTVTFSPFETLQSFFVSVISDTIVEAPNDTIMLGISNPVSATLGVQNSADLTIIDDDPATACGGALPGGEPNIGLPNGIIADIACGTELIVTLPATSTIFADGDTAFDMVFYEYTNPPGVRLDWVVIQLGTSISGPWHTVFYWGDDIVDANTNIGQSGNYGPTEPVNEPINSADLYNLTGIAIDVDARVPAGTYSYVRFYSPFGTTDPAQVDAISLYP